MSNRRSRRTGLPPAGAPGFRVRAAVLALVIGTSACAGGEADESPGSAPRETAPSPAETPAGRPGLVLSPVTPPPSPPPPAPAPPAPRNRPRAAAPNPGPAPAPGAPVAPSPAPAGTFLYGETGITRIRGCLTLDQPPPSPTKLVVGAAAGNRQHFDRDQRDPLGSGSLTAADLEFRPDGIYLSLLRQTQTSLLSSQPTEFQPNPAVLLLPAEAAPGHTWSFTLSSTDGGVKIESQNRVDAANEPVALANGQTVNARRIVADSRITGRSTQGTLDLTRKMTTWYAPQNGLPAKEVVDMKGRVGLCEVDSHIESTLQSL